MDVVGVVPTAAVASAPADGADDGAGSASSADVSASSAAGSEADGDDCSGAGAVVPAGGVVCSRDGGISSAGGTVSSTGGTGGGAAAADGMFSPTDPARSREASPSATAPLRADNLKIDPLDAPRADLGVGGARP